MGKKPPARKASWSSPVSKPPHKPKDVSWWHLALVALLAVSCYAQTATYGFVYDDDVQIVRNPRIRSFSNLRVAFSENIWAFNAPHSFTNYYRPMQTVTYMAGYAMGGGSALPFHCINIVMHTLASLTVFWLGWLIFRRAVIALWGALLFAAHSMHTESVAWIAGVTDVGCGLFYFASLAAYMRSREGGSNQRFWQGFALITFFLSLLYKEMALTLPLVLLLLEFLCEPAGAASSWRHRLRRCFPFLAVLPIYLFLRIRALGTFYHTVNPMALGIEDRILTILVFVGQYLQKLIVPVGHNAYYVFIPFSQLSLAEFSLPLVILVLGLGLAWKFLRPEGELVFLMVATVVTLAPVLNIGSVGQNVFTERYLYLPSAGFCLFVPAVINRYSSIDTRKIMLFVGCVMVVSLGFLTVHRNTVWRDNKTFYLATLKASPDAALIHNNLGILYFEERNLSATRREFQAALEADARVFLHSSRDRYNSLLGLSAVEAAEGKLEEAWKLAEEAKNLAPHLGDAYQTLGMLMGRKGHYAEARNLLRQSLEINPSNAVAHVNMGNVLVIEGDLSAAEREYRTAIDLDPRSVGARVSLGALLHGMHRVPEALSVLREALNLDPGNERVRQLWQKIVSGQQPSK